MPYVNHKAETYSTTQKVVDFNHNTEEKSNPKGRKQEKEKGTKITTQQPEKKKQEGNKYIPINNYFQCKWIKLNSPVKRHRVAEWKKKIRHLNAAYKILISDAKTQTTQTGRDGKKVFCENGNLMKVGVSILTSDKIKL